MPVIEGLEAVTAVEEVSPAGETAVSVDLSVVSQQLDQVIAWQTGQFASQWVLIGCFIGAVVAVVLGRWR